MRGVAGLAPLKPLLLRRNCSIIQDRNRSNQIVQSPMALMVSKLGDYGKRGASFEENSVWSFRYQAAIGLCYSRRQRDNISLLPDSISGLRRVRVLLPQRYKDNHELLLSSRCPVSCHRNSLVTFCPKEPWTRGRPRILKSAHNDQASM